MFEDSIPLALGGENQLDNFAHGAPAPWLSGHVMNVAAQELVSVGHADRQPNSSQYRQVDDVVAHIAHFLIFQACFLKDLLVRRKLFAGILLQEMNTQFLRPVFDGG